MKSNKKRTKRIIAAVLAFVIIAILLFMANGLVGNPISKMLVNRAATNYIDENYSDLDLKFEKAFYNFKDGRYIVSAKSDTSIDTYFEINFTGTGKLHYDSYEDSVLSKWNTRIRLDDEYRALVAKVLKNNFPYQSNIDYGELLDKDGNFNHLELDKIYDIKEMGKKEGKLILYIENEIQDKEIISKILFDIKRIFDERDVPFYSIDLTLEKPKVENKKYEDGLMVMDFLYKDIYLEGLNKRVEENIEDTKKHWEEEDKRSQEEVNRYEKESKEIKSDNK